MKLKTVGLNPKVPTQAITTALVAALAYFGVDLDPEVSAAIGVVVGFIAGYLAPAAQTKLVPATGSTGEVGQVNVIAIAAITALAVALLVYVLLVQ